MPFDGTRGGSGRGLTAHHGGGNCGGWFRREQNDPIEHTYEMRDTSGSGRRSGSSSSSSRNELQVLLLLRTATT